MSNNLGLWEKVCITDPNMTKEVTFGRKFTAIDPQYQIKNATEQFGAYGDTWGLKNINRNFELTDENDRPVLLVTAVFFYPNGEFELSTSAKMFSGKTPKFDEDVFKKIETDLLTKALSKLGFNADIFMGKFEDKRYVQEVRQDLADEEYQGYMNSIKKYIDDAKEEDKEVLKSWVLSYAKAESFEQVSLAKAKEIHKLIEQKKKKKAQNADNN